MSHGLGAFASLFYVKRVRHSTYFCGLGGISVVTTAVCRSAGKGPRSDHVTGSPSLGECRANAQQSGFEPSLVRIPRVLDETGLCTRHVLAMELLEGVPLAAAIVAEQDTMAAALGLSDGAELRARLMGAIRAHFKEGGGAKDVGAVGSDGDSADGRLHTTASTFRDSALLRAGEVAVPLVRQYAGLRQWVVGSAMCVGWVCAI